MVLNSSPNLCKFTFFNDLVFTFFILFLFIRSQGTIPTTGKWSEQGEQNENQKQTSADLVMLQKEKRTNNQLPFYLLLFIWRT